MRTITRGANDHDSVATLANAKSMCINILLFKGSPHGSMGTEGLRAPLSMCSSPQSAASNHVTNGRHTKYVRAHSKALTTSTTPPATVKRVT